MIGVPRSERGSEQEIVLARVPLDQRGRSHHVGRLDSDPTADETFQRFVLAFVTPDDRLRTIGNAEMPSDLQQPECLDIDVLPAGVGERIAHAGGVGLFDQHAPSSRLRVAGDTELLRQGHLLLTTSPFDRQEVRSTQPPLLHGKRVRKQVRRKGTDESIPEPTLLGRSQERAVMLRLRSLPEDLAGEDELRALFLHHPPGDPQHEDPAIDARVDPPAVAVLRIADDVQMLGGDVDNP